MTFSLTFPSGLSCEEVCVPPAGGVSQVELAVSVLLKNRDYHGYVRDEVHQQDPGRGSGEVNTPEDGFWFLVFGSWDDGERLEASMRC